MGELMINCHTQRILRPALRWMCLKSTFHRILLVLALLLTQSSIFACLAFVLGLLSWNLRPPSHDQETTGMWGQNITVVKLASVPSWLYLCDTREDAFAFMHSAGISLHCAKTKDKDRWIRHQSCVRSSQLLGYTKIHTNGGNLHDKCPSAQINK